VLATSGAFPPAAFPKRGRQPSVVIPARLDNCASLTSITGAPYSFLPCCFSEPSNGVRFSFPCLRVAGCRQNRQLRQPTSPTHVPRPRLLQLPSRHRSCLPSQTSSRLKMSAQFAAKRLGKELQKVCDSSPRVLCALSDSRASRSAIPCRQASS